MSEHLPVIGIECHVQLHTKTKLFCACPIVHKAEPNSAICPVCTGQPGALPAINGHAIELGIRAGLALGCTIHPRSRFARKNYFYPDLPKGYQISQFDEPICTEGAVHALIAGEVRSFALERIHLEEDAGKLIHAKDGSHVDWNRAGTALAEIVSKPVIKSADEAVAYMRSLHRSMVQAKICQGDMEKGHMRFDVNISVHREGEPWGTRVEIKNLNSFRFAKKAIHSEIARQIKTLEQGGSVRQHTRGWDGTKTVPLREKEGASDYRYFPDPDLPPLVLQESEINEQKALLPPCPIDLHWIQKSESKKQRWVERYGIEEASIEIILADGHVAAFFKAAVAEGGHPKEMAGWVQTELARHLKSTDGMWNRVAIKPKDLVELQSRIDAGQLSHTAAKTIFELLFREGGDIDSHIQKKGLAQVQDQDTLLAWVLEVMEEHPSECQSIREGNLKIMGFLMGQLMRKSRGAADPSRLKNLLTQQLKDEE